jgi:hypothetical protein
LWPSSLLQWRLGGRVSMVFKGLECSRQPRPVSQLLTQHSP